MKYVFTNHSKQRRPHHTPKTEEELIEVMNCLNEQLNFNSLEDGKYKIAHKGNSVILFKKKEVITVITLRGFKNSDDTKNDQLTIRLRRITEEEDEQKARRKTVREAKKEWAKYYPSIFEDTTKGGYRVFFPDVHGCTFDGTNFEASLKGVQKVLSLHLSEMITKGSPVPKINLENSKKLAIGHILVMIKPDLTLLRM